MVSRPVTKIEMKDGHEEMFFILNVGISLHYGHRVLFVAGYVGMLRIHLYHAKSHISQRLTVPGPDGIAFQMFPCVCVCVC